ncbi:putative ubiquitin-like protein [Golovinomyces cichoracearum]|uniref:Ubiquitin-like modifier HUB1 n=1 Tax=Golovinomyces cichoracearum TaxID=62708 RepID=A0A420IPW7_9PEZI|nr:putative ubiquitin-like protein [Golovinomyces cichoracearum]
MNHSESRSNSLKERETRRESRGRTCSPRRESRNSHQRHNYASGFKWKDTRQNERRDHQNTNERTLERGYRNRSSSPRRNQDQTRSRNTRTEDKYNIADKFGSSLPAKEKLGHEEKRRGIEADSLPSSTTASTTTTTKNHGEPMIIVHVNDRLGTRAAIPCLASDPIRLFKAQVAARIGRQPHEIMLKRQGERPFKDQLTLEDYGISNGVQIDLEIDTGD